MRNKTKKQFYAPAFSELSVVSIRRFAWALGQDMGRAVEAMVLLLPSSISKDKVCAACKDNGKCSTCVFKCGAVPPLNLLDLVK